PGLPDVEADSGAAAAWDGDPVAMRRLASIAVALMTMPVSASLPLMAQSTATLDGGVILDDAGRTTPVSRARVVAANQLSQAWVDTDVDGRFHLEGLRPGAYHLTVLKFGFVPQGRVPSVIAGGTAAEIMLHMQRGAAIEGRVVTETGQPVAGL